MREYTFCHTHPPSLYGRTDFFPPSAFFFFLEINKFKFKDFVVALDSEDDIVDIFRCHALTVAKASLRHK